MKRQTHVLASGRLMRQKVPQVHPEVSEVRESSGVRSCCMAYLATVQARSRSIADDVDGPAPQRACGKVPVVPGEWMRPRVLSLAW
jgi:hypothetical protein